MNILETSLTQVSIYLTKFRARLNANHALHLKQLVHFLDRLRSYAVEWLSEKRREKKLEARVEVMTVAELMQRLGRKVEGLNMLEIEAYLHDSKVGRLSSSAVVITDV